MYKVIDLCEAAANDNVEDLKLILDKQPDLLNQHVSEGDERMAIHFAIIQSSQNAVKFLMERGSDPHAGIYPHRNATTALTMARERNETEIEKIILQEEEKRQLAACRNIVISPESEALFELIKKQSNQ